MQCVCTQPNASTLPVLLIACMLTIAEAVALELGSAAAFLEVINACITLFNVCAVLTFTFLAVFIVFGTATVAAIPGATSVVAVQNNNAEVMRRTDISRCRASVRTRLACMLQIRCSHGGLRRTCYRRNFHRPSNSVNRSLS